MPVVLSIGTNAYWTSDIVNILETIKEFNKTQKNCVFYVVIGRYGLRSAVLPASGGSLEGMTDTLMIVPFVDQFAVLESDSVVAFVSHCGFGSILVAIHTATPVLAMPMMLESDQVQLNHLCSPWSRRDYN